MHLRKALTFASTASAGTYTHYEPKHTRTGTYADTHKLHVTSTHTHIHARTHAHTHTRTRTHTVDRMAANCAWMASKSLEEWRDWGGGGGAALLLLPPICVCVCVCMRVCVCVCVRVCVFVCV